MAPWAAAGVLVPLFFRRAGGHPAGHPNPADSADALSCWRARAHRRRPGPIPQAEGRRNVAITAAGHHRSPRARHMDSGRRLGSRWRLPRRSPAPSMASVTSTTCQRAPPWARQRRPLGPPALGRFAERMSQPWRLSLEPADARSATRSAAGLRTSGLGVSWLVFIRPPSRSTGGHVTPGKQTNCTPAMCRSYSTCSNCRCEP